jgi:hypothetical protein
MEATFLLFMIFSYLATPWLQRVVQDSGELLVLVQLIFYFLSLPEVDVLMKIFCLWCCARWDQEARVSC